MSFGENLQYYRKREEITQEQLAEKMEVSRQTISKWEAGTSYPEMEKILQLCDHVFLQYGYPYAGRRTGGACRRFLKI